MSVKVLNLIIIFSIIGLVIFTVHDIFFQKPKKVLPNVTYIQPTLPLAKVTNMPQKATPILCSRTFLGDIPYKVLRYRSETKNSIVFSNQASGEAQTLVERLDLNLEKKTDTSYVFVGDKKTDQRLAIECTSEGVNAEIFGNKFLLLPSASIKKGTSWSSSFFLNVPLGFGGSLADFDFIYTIAETKTGNILGSQRQIVVVNVTANDLKAAQYSVASGVGIENALINIDLENFGGYTKKLQLQSAQ